MAINKNVLAENQATVLAEDGNVMYATIQMRHGKESEMDKSKFVPAEMGVATDTKKAFMAFSPGDVKEIMFREDSEIEELLGEVRKISDQAVEAVESAEVTAKQVIEDYTNQMKATIPEDYTEIVKKVDVLERTKAPAIMQTATGKSLQIEDSADAPISGLRVFGKSRQVKTTGAQILDLRTAVSINNSGITISYSGDGELILNGIVPDVSSPDIYIAGNWGGSKPIATGTITLKVYGATSDERIYLINGSSHVSAYGNSSVSISEQVTAVMIRLKIGKTYSAFRIKPMLNAGETALPWEPYTGGKTSPSPDYPQEIEIPGSEGNVGVNVTGAQLAPINKAKSNEGVTVSFNSDGSLNITGTPNRQYTSVLYEDVELEPGDYYVASGISGPNSEEGKMLLQVVAFKPSGTKYYVNTGFTIDGTETRIVCNIIYNSATLRAINLFNFKPMLNRGSTALPWEPYHTPQKLTLSTPNGLPGVPVESGGNYTDSDGQQWVCDEVDFKRGKYVQRVKSAHIDSSYEDKIIQGVNNKFYFSLTDLGIPKAYTGNYSTITQHEFCTRFIEAPLYDVNNSEKENVFIIQANASFRVNENTTLEEFKEILELGIDFIYPLDTPIETDLSEEELAAYAALRTNYPTTVVTSDSNPAVDMEIEYVADTKTYIDNKFAELAQNLVATQNTLLEV